MSPERSSGVAKTQVETEMHLQCRFELHSAVRTRQQCDHGRLQCGIALFAMAHLRHWIESQSRAPAKHVHIRSTTKPLFAARHKGLDIMLEAASFLQAYISLQESGACLLRLNLSLMDDIAHLEVQIFHSTMLKQCDFLRRVATSQSSRLSAILQRRYPGGTSNK